MASISAASGSAMLRGGSKPAPRPAAHGISSLRVKPFMGKSANGRSGEKRVFRTRAAEPEAGAAAAEAEAAVDEAMAPAPEDDFDFNLSDAKKNNQYMESDVEAALRFYFEGGPAPAANDDFVSNLLGEEDASYFDDIDNNEAYETDEFQVAGIPEAAPKQKGRGRRGGGQQDDEEDDNISKGKAMDKLKEMEDKMVLEAAMEEDFGSMGRIDDGVAAVATAQQGVWDWLVDADSAADELDTARVSSVRRSAAELPSDYEVLSGFSTLKVDELDEQTRDMLELIIGDEVTEDELKTVDAAVELDLPAGEGLSQEESAELDALAEKEVEQLEIDAPEPRAPVAAGAEENQLAKSDLDTYVASLSTAAKNDGDMGIDQVKELFASENEAVDVEAEPELADDAEVAKLMSAADVQVPSEESLDLEAVNSLLISAEEEADYEVKDIKTELRTLAALEDFGEDDMPDEEQLAILDQYVTSAEEFLAAESERKASAEKMVMDGELSADVFADELEEVPDMERDFAEEFATELAKAEDDDYVAYDDEDDTENWQERILELNRVTKVVKGGKLMGFRCTAIVGNGNGLVGVGCQAGREVAVAAKRAITDARRNIVRVPIVGAGTIPHKIDAKYHAARITLVPASDGTGVIAGGSIKSVLELAGVSNVLAKRIGCRSALNNARATIAGLSQLRSLNEVARNRGVPMERLLLPRKE